MTSIHPIIAFLLVAAVCISEAKVLSQPEIELEAVEFEGAKKYIYKLAAGTEEYLLAPFKMSFDAGIKFCSDYGMKLGEILDEATDIAVMTVLTGANANDGWTSGKCTSAKCATGFWASTNRTFSSESYKNWGSGQPGQLPGCICFEKNPFSAYSWAVDVNCSNKKTVVCESVK